MLLKHLPHTWGLVGIQSYTEMRVGTTGGVKVGTRSQVLIFLCYICSLLTDLHSFSGLLSLSSCSEHHNGERNEYLFCLCLWKQISLWGLMFFWITKVKCSLWNCLGRYQGCQTACSFVGSGQYCFLIMMMMMTMTLTAIMMSDLKQKKMAYSLAGEMPRTLMKQLENKWIYSKWCGKGSKCSWNS